LKEKPFLTSGTKFTNEPTPWSRVLEKMRVTQWAPEAVWTKTAKRKKFTFLLVIEPLSSSP
jgi:hypothetical protein